MNSQIFTNNDNRRVQVIDNGLWRIVLCRDHADLNAKIEPVFWKAANKILINYSISYMFIILVFKECFCVAHYTAPLWCDASEAVRLI